MVKYKKPKRTKKKLSSNLKKKPFKRFVEIERRPIDDMLDYIQETIEVVYHTIFPFIAGYFFHTNNNYNWIAFVVLLIPLIFRFAYIKKEKKSKIYFRL